MKQMTKREEKQMLFGNLQTALLENRPLQARILMTDLYKLPLSYLEQELLRNYDVLVKSVEAGRRWDWYGHSDYQ